MLHTDTQTVAVNDEPEYKTYCPLCSLSGLASNVLIRGVCAESLLDTAYTLPVFYYTSRAGWSAPLHLVSPGRAGESIQCTSGARSPRPPVTEKIS